MKMTPTQRQWVKLTKKIDKLESEILQTKAERMSIKTSVMEEMKCWGLRDEAITNRLRAA
jgi:hypothetical protein